jgi:hypothetical protein
VRLNQSFSMTSFLNRFSEGYSYLPLLLAHIAFGAVLCFFPSLGSFYGISIVVFGLIYIIRNKNKNQEVLQVASYCTGSEVLLRMTHSVLNYEFAKYILIGLAVLGIFYNGLSRKSWPYWIYLLAFTPSLFFENDINNISRRLLNGIVFDLSGPICLGVIAIYAVDKKLSLTTMNSILFAIGLPILSCSMYVFLYSPDISIYLRGVNSNYFFSGGFGPNQVATVLGFGMFIFFTQFMINSATKIRFVVHLLIFTFLCYLGFMTFSRGGMITGCLICIVFLFSIYRNSKTYGKKKSKQGLLYFVSVLLIVITLISYQTNGLILKRYTNLDHRGKSVKDSVTDRDELAKIQINLFVENPIFGIGLGEGMKILEKEKLRSVRSHDELTRLIANHGILGLLNILILIITPLLLHYKLKQNIYLVTFFTFWFLTINHSGMRIALPAFLYALMLLKVSIDDDIFFKTPNKLNSI